MFYLWFLMTSTACIWAYVSVRAWYTYRSVPNLTNVDPVDNSEAPSLTVVVCACNEATTIESALRTLVTQEYPDWELLVVNDRSNDETGPIIDRLALEFPRIRPIHIRHLPENWLGKVHAQHLALQEARGQWILYTDADIHFSPQTLSRAMSLAKPDIAQHIVALPRLRMSGFWERIFTATFPMMLMSKMYFDQQGVLQRNAFLGVGAFNLIHRQTAQKLQPFRWLRMEVVDDIGLGLAFNRSNYKTRIALATEHLAVTWYPSFTAMAKGLEKNIYGAIAHWRPLKAVIRITLLILWALSPWLVLGTWHLFPCLSICAGIALFITAVTAVPTSRHAGQSPWFSLLFTPGALLMAIIAARAAILAHYRKGVYWRNTFYPLKLLRQGQRVFL